MNSFKQVAFSALILTALVAASCGGNKPNYNIVLKNDTDSASFYLGYMYGKNIGNAGIDNFNVDALAKGVQDAVNKTEISASQEEINMFLQKYFTALEGKVKNKNLKEGEDWLEANKKKEGVVTLPSGLQYRIIKEGNGAKPSREDDVDVIYHGTLTDGTVFDSSKERQDTATFNVSGVIPGFTEALTLMSEGSVWEVYIPTDLGYGENVDPRGPIKPNSALVFEIDLIKVTKGNVSVE